MDASVGVPLLPHGVSLCPLRIHTDTLDSENHPKGDSDRRCHPAVSLEAQKDQKLRVGILLNQVWFPEGPKTDIAHLIGLLYILDQLLWI